MGSYLIRARPKSHILEKWRSLKVQIILAEDQNAHRSIYRVMFSLLLLTAVWQHARPEDQTPFVTFSDFLT